LAHGVRKSQPTHAAKKRSDDANTNGDATSAGQLLGVDVPDSKRLTLPLPKGAKAGDKLQVFYDSENCTLTVLTDE